MDGNSEVTREAVERQFDLDDGPRERLQQPLGLEQENVALPAKQIAMSVKKKTLKKKRRGKG